MLNRTDLHEYQNKAVGFIEDKPFCALWVDMGLGKTVSTLTAIANLLDNFEVARVLVIAPLRVAKDTWPDEIQNWEHTRGLTYSILCGTAKQRIERKAKQTEIHIINRENVKWLVDLDKKNWPYDMVVIDESDSFKSSKSQRFKALKKVLPKIDRIVQLTGTPASKGLLDLWSQIFLLDKGERLGKTYSGFRDRYFMSDYMGYNFELREGSEEKIYEKLDDICLTLAAEDYLKMPERIDNLITVEMPSSCQRLYAELEKDFLLELEQDTVEALNAAALTNKLLQFCNGAIYTDAEGTYSTVHDAKLDALASIVAEAAGQPVLVAYNFKSDAKRIKERFKNAVILNEAGDDAVKRWNNGEIPILLAHPASAGHGLNLQKGGNIAVWFGLNWSLALYQQFNARLHRQGQTKPVFIHTIAVADSVDMTVLESLASKNTTQKALLNALKKDIQLKQEQAA